MARTVNAFYRTKTLGHGSERKSQLARVLSASDLTLLGVGSTLGAGVYVVTSDIARNVAGPGVVFSFLIAAFASVLSGLCYAEFGARVPKAGSAYIYSYVTVGELCAFIIGWNLLLEYMIGAAAVARAWSAYFNSLVNNSISKGLLSFFGHIHMSGMSHYLDIFALFITIVISSILAVGVKRSTLFQNIITFVNLVVILFIIAVGMTQAKISNWKKHFLPYGISGVMVGSATAFFAFVGFDVIASTGEEAQDPGRDIPISIVLSLGICFCCYSGVASVVTLMVPYQKLDVNAALPKVFEQSGLGWAKYFIAVGALCGLTASLTGAMFPLPRLLYAMSSDGLIFKQFSWVNQKTETPVFSTLISGTLAGILAMLFELESLVEMMSIGTLQAYTIVSTCVLLLRYQRGTIGVTNDEDVPVQDKSKEVEREPTQRTSRLVAMAVTVLFFDLFAISSLLIYGSRYVFHGHPWAVVTALAFLAILVSCCTVIVLQPQNLYPLPFKVPLVPFLPILSMLVNIYLMMELSAITWVRFGIWMFIGLTIYLAYGLQNSLENPANKQDLEVKNVHGSLPIDDSHSRRR